MTQHSICYITQNEQTKAQTTNLSVSEANGCTTNDVPNIINRSHLEKSCNDKNDNIHYTRQLLIINH